jgi:hypothetical protein
MASKEIEQQYHYQVDQQVSINGFFDVEIGGETVKFQVTNRYGATPEKIAKTVKTAIEAFALLRQEYPRQVMQPAPQEPTRQPIDDSGNALPEVLTATAGRLSWEVHDGRTSYKVMDAIFAPGAKGTKYGITVWPEVLKQAGLSVDAGQPTPNIAGWIVNYICNEKGYPQKVTRLLPPK